jgi:uncharacterized coiled-coil protein SlyX
MSYECEFCGNKFTMKCNLLYHQRTAKYCLSKRGIVNDQNVCDICGKNFSEKRQLQMHMEKCSLPKRLVDLEEQLAKKESSNANLTKKLIEYAQKNRDNQKTIENLQKQISDLQSKLENIAIQGVKKTTITNILNLEPMTKDWLDTQALLLTDSHFSKGVAGLAQFAVNNSFKDRVVCTDANRKSLRYKEEDGKISKDPKGKKLSKMFFESIQSKADDMLPAMIEKIKQELDDAGEEPSVFDAIMGKITELINVEKGIKQISKGEEHDLKEEFTRELCELLPNP